MTYCVGMMLDAGLVLMSDTRTNSGVDNISTFRKMFSWQVPGERIITLMTSGNLATTQAVISQLEERNKIPGDRHPTILEAPTMFQVASEVGRMLRTVIEGPGDRRRPHKLSFEIAFVLKDSLNGSLNGKLFVEEVGRGCRAEKNRAEEGRGRGRGAGVEQYRGTGSEGEGGSEAERLY